MKLLIPIGLLVLGRWVFGKINLAQNITFQIIDVALRAGLPFSSLYITLKLVNPTTHKLTVNSLNGEVVVNGTNIGRALLNQSFNINANSSVDVEIVCYLNSFSVVTSLLKILKTKGAAINFNGAASVENILLPINYTYTI
jgi:LEA14-like dessication related protein